MLLRAKLRNGHGMAPQTAFNMTSLLPVKFSSVTDEDTLVGKEPFSTRQALEEPNRKARINGTRMGNEEKSFMVGSGTVVVYGCWVR
jgi:hypothetical protein